MFVAHAEVVPAEQPGQAPLDHPPVPPNTARSGTRGRPPFGFGGSFGNSNSKASQRSSDKQLAHGQSSCHARGVLRRALKLDVWRVGARRIANRGFESCSDSTMSGTSGACVQSVKRWQQWGARAGWLR